MSAKRERWRTLLRVQRQALRDKNRVQIDAQRAQPSFLKTRAKQRRRRMQQLALVLLVILLLLLLRLDCTDVPSTASVSQPAAVEIEPKAAELPKKPLPRKPQLKLVGQIKASDRASMALESLEPPPWLPQFRLQVAARSPRLASCFDGAERSGALRWSALVHARAGRVTESVVEPVFRGVNLEEAQLDCLVKGLSELPYVLDEPDPQAAARRVSLIFEF